MNVPDLRQVIRRFWVLILCSGLGVAGVAFAAAYLKATYQVTSQVLLRPVVPDPQLPTLPQVGLITPSGLNVLELRGDTYSALLQSRQVAERVVARLHATAPAGPAAPAWRERARQVTRALYDAVDSVLHLRAPFARLTPHEEEIREVQEGVTGKLLPKSAVFRMTAEHRKADRATSVARLAAETFVEFAREFNAAEAVLTRKFLEEQAQEAREILQAAQRRIDQFRQERGILMSLDDEGKQRVTDFLAQESTSRVLLAELRQAQAKIREALKDLEEQKRVVQSSVTTDANPMVRDLRIKLIELEARLPALEVDHAPNHPQVVALKQQLEEIRRLLRAEDERVRTAEVTALNPIHQSLLTTLLTEQINLEGLSERKTTTDTLLAEIRRDLASLSGTKNTWDLLTADVKFYANRLEKIQGDLDVARLTEAKKLDEVRILDVGTPPRFPKWKGLPLLAFPAAGLLLGVIGGSGLAVALHLLDRSVRDPETASRRLNLPLYGVLEGTSGVAVDDLQPTADPLWDSYRRARLRLLNVSVGGRPLRCMVVATVTPDDDPAAVAVRLAAVYAESGLRTLVVDCRNGRAGDGNPSLPPFRSETLEIITNGNNDLPSSADSLRPEKLAQLLRNRRAAYDVVLLLAGPVQTSLNAIELSSSLEVDATLLVVRQGATDLEACLQAKSGLEEVGVRHIGLIYAR